MVLLEEVQNHFISFYYKSVCFAIITCRHFCKNFIVQSGSFRSQLALVDSL